jgi:uncharacterized membrane protein YeiH
VLGTVSAVGGGVMRDALLGRVPVILSTEIYALAALVAAVMQVVAEVNGWLVDVAPWFAIGTCLVIRLLAVRYSWALPVVSRR